MQKGTCGAWMKIIRAVAGTCPCKAGGWRQLCVCVSVRSFAFPLFSVGLFFQSPFRYFVALLSMVSHEGRGLLPARACSNMVTHRGSAAATDNSSTSSNNNNNNSSSSSSSSNNNRPMAAGPDMQRKTGKVDAAAGVVICDVIDVIFDANWRKKIAQPNIINPRSQENP